MCRKCAWSRRRSRGCHQHPLVHPHRCHTAIGVFGAVSAATACLIEGSVAHAIAHLPGGEVKRISVEHPTGEFSVEIRLHNGQIAGCGLIRTARLLFEGRVCVPESLSQQ